MQNKILLKEFICIFLYLFICRVGNPAEGLANGTAAGLEIMVLMLDGNSEIDAHVRSKLSYLIWQAGPPKEFLRGRGWEGNVISSCTPSLLN